MKSFGWEGARQLLDEAEQPQDAVAVSGFCRLGRAAVGSLAGHSIINGSLHPYAAEAATAETMLALQCRRTENAALQQADS